MGDIGLWGQEPRWHMGFIWALLRIVPARRRVQARAGVWRAQACAKGCGAMSWLGGWRFYTLFSEAHARGSRPGLQGLSARVAMVAMDARDAFDQSESCRKQ